MTEILFQLVGGVGLLIFGIEIMKDSLEKITSGRSQKMLEASTSTLKGIVMGTLATMINQKSSVTTMAAVGLVNTGILTLVQAAGIIMGANIGTTVTAQILAFRLELIAPFIVGVAVMLWRFTKNRRLENFSQIFIGFGLMFIGLIFLENAMNPMRDMPEVQLLMEKITEILALEYLFGILAGFIATILLRSSSVVTGLLIAMAAQGLLNFDFAMSLILGLNIGKCIFPLLDSFGASRTAKKVAVLHLIFNIVGTILFVAFFRNLMTDTVALLAPHDLARQIAHAHTIFNLGTTIVCAPFLPLLVLLSDKVIPFNKEEVIQEALSLDVRMLETPGIALAQSQHEVSEMAEIAMRNYSNSVNSLSKSSERQVQRSHEDEDQILRKQKEIQAYLVKLSKKEISEDQRESINLMLGVTSDIEQISEMAVRISTLALELKNRGIHFSDDCFSELLELHNKIDKSAGDMLEALRNNDPLLASNILTIENRVRSIEDDLRESHVERLSQGVCQPGAGALFMDLLGYLVHVAEHIKKVGQFIVESSKY